MKKGKISLATGPMFSGKTEWLIKNLDKYKSKEILAIRYSFDNRYSTDSISSHNGLKLKAQGAKNLSDIEILVKNTNYEIIGIDEIQFFEPEISDFLSLLKRKGTTILTAGLNVDYLNTPWETTERIAKIADEVNKFTAICSVCKKKNATITKRAGRSHKRIIVGGDEIYEPRCINDFALEF